MARLWPWIEKSPARRFSFAAIVAVAASLLHWLIFPLTHGRTSFIFFPPAIILVTTIAGRWPGILVASIGVLNSALQKDPQSLFVFNSADQVAVIASALVAAMLIWVGDYYRSISRRELLDLHELHELSATLASIPTLPDQLRLIMHTYARMHGADKGLISIFDQQREVLTVTESFGFSPAALEILRERGMGSSAMACIERARVVIEDTERDPRFASMREVARNDGVRAVHATPLISRDGKALGTLTVHFPTPRKPTEREFRIADICARKAAVFIERARAEERVSERDRRFESVLSSSGVPFVLLSPVRDASGKITDFRWSFLNAAAARVMRCEPAEVRRTQGDRYVSARVAGSRPFRALRGSAREKQGARDRAAVRGRWQSGLVSHRRFATRRKSCGVVRGYHATQAAGARTHRGRPPQRRIPRDAGA